MVNDVLTRAVAAARTGTWRRRADVDVRRERPRSFAFYENRVLSNSP